MKPLILWKYQSLFCAFSHLPASLNCDKNYQVAIIEEQNQCYTQHVVGWKQTF